MNFNHYSLLLLAGIICLNTATAQPRITDQGTIGGALEDRFTSIYHTSDGGVIVGGNSTSRISGQKTENTRGAEDYWIVKIDNAGNIEWDKTIGGSRNDYLGAVQQTSDGGYILGGHSISPISGEKTEDSRGNTDYWIVKLDANGNKEWDKTIGGAFEDYFYSIQQTVDGGYILGGTSRSPISGEKTEDTKGYQDYWVVKLDGAGNKEWDRSIGTTDDDYIGTVQQTTDSGYIVGGYTYAGKSGDKTGISRGGGDYWVVKLDAAGTIEWDKTVGGSGNEVLQALQQTGDGGYILGGYSVSNISGQKTENSRGYFDYWIVKLNDTGAVQWDKTIGGTDLEELYGLEQTGDGGYLLSGSSGSGISGEKTENRVGGAGDYWVVKTNSRGIVQWDKTIGGLGSDFDNKAIELKKNLYIVSGSSFSGPGGDKVGSNRDPKKKTADFWIVKLKYVKPDSTTIAQLPAISRPGTPLHNNIFNAYPNPANDKLTISSSGKATFILTNQQGKILIKKEIENKGIMYLNNVPAGVYLLTNTTTGATQKIVISR